MNNSFLDARGRNNNHWKKTSTDTGNYSASGSDGILNDATPHVDAAMKVVSPSMVEEIVAMECHVLNTPGVGPNPPPPTQEANAPACNAHGKPSYATATGKPSGKKVNVCTLYTPGGNGIDVVVPVDSIRAISERFANTAYGFFLEKKVAYPVVANYVRNTWNENLLKEDVSTVPVWVKLYGVPVTAFSEDGLSAITNKIDTPLMPDSYTSDMCIQSWGRSSYARVMIELRADVKLKDTREGHYTCNVRVDYERKPPRCSSFKVFRHIHEECSKNTCVDEKKTVKKPSQTSRGVLVGPKISFKHQKEYRPVTKKPIASSSGNKKKGVKPNIDVSNSNPFSVLNSVDNDVKFGTNEGTTKLVNNEATSSGSSYMNIDDGEFACNTPVGEKFDKIERKICEGKLRLLDNDKNPLVPKGIVENDSEVEVVFDETANLRISTSGKDESDKDYGTNSLLEQWRDSYPDNDDYDPYDDDMYENRDLSEHLQAICDDLDITVRDNKKK
nr:hypothetical protein [Tanacetum cinerariifolium]